jgi:biotin transport system substrate-specific component
MTSYVDIIRPANRSFGLVYDLFSILCGSLFLALMAQFSIDLWFTPVPITLQTFGVLLLGALLGAKRGALAVIAYLGEGALGFPVFAGGAGGISILLGPTGGYLFAFIAAAFLIGFLLERGWKDSYLRTSLALLMGYACMLGLGALWLSFFVGAKNALFMGIYPFIIGCFLKTLAAAALIPSGWKAIDFLK